MKSNNPVEVRLAVGRMADIYFYAFRWKFSFKLNFLVMLVFSALSVALKIPSGPCPEATVPFLMDGKTILVEATVDGHTGYFILDTGAPGLILNCTHFKGYSTILGGAELVDLHGNLTNVEEYRAKEIQIGGMELPGNNAVVMDLAGLERTKKIAIAGIMGFGVFRRHEIVLDFEKQELHIIKLNKDGLPVCSIHAEPSDSLKLRMSSHIPFITAHLGHKKLKMGLDTGSEVNVLQKKILKKKMEVTFQEKGRLLVTGVAGIGKKQAKGLLRGFSVKGNEVDYFETTLTDMSTLNESLNIELDGLLGYPFFSNGLVALNYKRKMVYFWKPVEEQLAVRIRHNANRLLK